MMENGNAGIAALKAEYQRAAAEFREIILAVDQIRFENVYDETTTDPDCRSIRTIVNHVVRAGYGYANYVRKTVGIAHFERQTEYDVSSPSKAMGELDGMMAYTEETLDGISVFSDDQLAKYRIESNWGVHYDIEQLLEHAIVHILRHRRQVERFLAGGTRNT